MKNKKMLGTAFFVVAILLFSTLVVSIIDNNAGEVTKTFSDLNVCSVGDSSSVYIDPDIYLSYNESIAFQQIIDHPDVIEYKAFLQEIIDTIELKGFVNSEDLSGMESLPQLPETKIFRGRLHGTACCGCSMFGFPMIPFFGCGGWIGTAVFVLWSAYGDEINLRVGGLYRLIDYEHNGFCAPFVGYWFYDLHVNSQGIPIGGDFVIWGRSPLIIISPL